MGSPTWNKGRKLENQVEQLYIDKGYRTWKPPKTTFGAQDILGIGDIVATTPQEFVLIAVALNKAQTATMVKIKALIPLLPEYITVRYYIYKANLKKGDKFFEIREWKGQS